MSTLRQIGTSIGQTPGTSLRRAGEAVRFVMDDTSSMRAVIHALEGSTTTPAQKTRPFYRRTIPAPQSLGQIGFHPTAIDVRHVAVPAFGPDHTVDRAAQLFDARAAAAVRNLAEPILASAPGGSLVEEEDYGEAAPKVVVPKRQCLPILAAPDYFPEVEADAAIQMVSDAVMAANPGWCGTFGPGVDDAFDLLLGDVTEGDYDMAQMHLVHMAYRYYERLTPPAQEQLIRQLLARGRIHRPRLDDTFTSGGNPNDWSRAGFVNPLGIAKVRIGETENHILMILTARYLTNQLLYQRDHHPDHDNRRNGNVMGGPNCMDLLLALLRDILRGDFSEYNAKNYQTQTRYALLNLNSFAYDHEVRLAARMALDYVSARIALSSSDLRRMVPFRRRNEGVKVARDNRGFMMTGLLEMTHGADPSAQHFAMLAGNTRIYEARGGYIKADEGDGNDAVVYALSDYRLPPTVHDFFITDAHRRFYQILHRTPMGDPEVGGRNCDNLEIYAGSPSYLISAGGAFATWAIDPGPVSLSKDLRQQNDQQLGVAVTTSFLPTFRPAGDCGDPTAANSLIQLGRFSDITGVFNYGVAPDFACGPQIYLPEWCQEALQKDSANGLEPFRFVNRGSGGSGPGFYLALFQNGTFALLEAFDTWLHPHLSFEQFRSGVVSANGGLVGRGLRNNVAEVYTTQNGNRIRFVITDEAADYGARILDVDSTNSLDAVADSVQKSGGNPDRFLAGTVMNSTGDGIVEIANRFLNTRIILDMSDQSRPRRTSETGDVEEAGRKQEVWVDFAWPGPHEGDVYRPFNTLAGALAVLAPGGAIRIMP